MKDKLIQIRVDAEFLSKLEYLWHINGFKSIAETVRKVIEKEWRKEKTNNEWISVTERLPQDAYTRDFLVTVKFDDSKPIVMMCTWGRFCNGYNDDGHQDAFSAPKKCVMDGATYWITQPVPMDKVVAWMPIPKPYGRTRPQRESDGRT